MTALLALVGLGLVLLGWRFGAGLGAVTALSDGYPWGLWIAFDVVTGTALGCGGYALAILIYILNRGRYHPLIRSAIVTSALGYTLGGIGVVIDVGRYWNVLKVPFFFWEWNLNSILLEVALCIMLYTLVLWIELSPAFLDRWSASPRIRLRAFAERATPVVERALPWLIALGLLLPTMHQSSLGSLMLLAGHKLHPLWQTPLLPLLFLVSCIGMGYGVVILESTLSSRAYGLPRETRTLGRLAPTVAFVLLLWVVLRVVDLAFRGRLPLVFSSGELSLWFALEMVLFLVPAVSLMSGRLRWKVAHLFRAAVMVVLGGALYRFSTYLIAYDPGPGWSYFPAVPELLVTVGLVAGEVAAYVLLIKTFPILGGARPSAARA
jgi:Ni/Fe-hydrogenase subunit HybB-like protein